MSSRPRHGTAVPALVSALALSALLAVAPAALHALRGQAATAAGSASPPPATAPSPSEPQPVWPSVQWRSSIAVGRPNAGRLVRGVELPPEGENFFTWDAVLERSPNRAWRRHGTDRLVRTLLAVSADYRAANPGAPRVCVADLSRPRGGDFGSRFGGLGHASHQNGLDVDVCYPRFDRLEQQSSSPDEIDHALAQDLVDRFVATGAQYVFVGPHTGLRGPRRVVQKLVYHDDHMHVRVRPRH